MLALVELSVMEQRYRAVIEIENGCPVTEVAARYGVSRQTVHTWKNRYLQGGLAAQHAMGSYRTLLLIDAHLIHVVTDGQLPRALPSPLPPTARSRPQPPA